MKKIYTVLIVLTLLWITSTHASSDRSDDTGMRMADDSMMHNGSGSKMKEIREKMREEMKAKRDQVRDETKANREEMKDNIKEFKEMHGGTMLQSMSGSLTEDQKTQIKALHDKHKTEMATLMLELKAAKWDDTKMAAVFVKIEAARTTHLDALKSIVGADSILVKIVDERKMVFEENKALREENREKRKELRDGIEGTVMKYKEIFIQRIAKKLEKLSPEQIQKIIDKVNTQITKVEASTKLSDENKAKIKAQLVALRETLEDRLDTSDAQSDMLEVQSMIESVGQ